MARLTRAGGTMAMETLSCDEVSHRKLSTSMAIRMAGRGSLHLRAHRGDDLAKVPLERLPKLSVADEQQGSISRVGEVPLALVTNVELVQRVRHLRCALAAAAFRVLLHRRDSARGSLYVIAS